MKGFLNKLFGKEESKKPIIIVSGLPRSGTSMMMKMLEAGGIPVFIDGIRTADTDNPKGYYEFERVKQLDKGDQGWVKDSQGHVVKVISALLKHLPEEYEYHIVFMRRHMEEILASQRKMLKRRGEDPNKMDDAKMTELFEKHLVQIDKWIRAQPNMRYMQIHYSDLLAEPESNAKKVNEFLGNYLSTQAMAEVIDPDLYRNRAQ